MQITISALPLTVGVLASALRSELLDHQTMLGVGQEQRVMGEVLPLPCRGIITAHHRFLFNDWAGLVSVLICDRRADCFVFCLHWDGHILWC